MDGEGRTILSTLGRHRPGAQTDSLEPGGLGQRVALDGHAEALHDADGGYMNAASSGTEPKASINNCV